MTSGPVLLPFYLLTSVNTFVVRRSSQSRSVSNALRVTVARLPYVAFFFAYGQEDYIMSKEPLGKVFWWSFYFVSKILINQENMYA